MWRLVTVEVKRNSPKADDATRRTSYTRHAFVRATGLRKGNTLNSKPFSKGVLSTDASFSEISSSKNYEGPTQSFTTTNNHRCKQWMEIIKRGSVSVSPLGIGYKDCIIIDILSLIHDLETKLPSRNIFGVSRFIGWPTK